MRIRGLATILLSLAAPAGADTPTPFDQRLPAGATSLIAAPAPFQAPRNFPGWPADDLFHYRLHLPADYHDGDARYPVMFIVAPDGTPDLGAMAARLERDRWIVAMPLEARNRTLLWYPSFVAIYEDLVRRLRVQRDMLFCTGFSGGARICAAFPGIRPGFRGLILQAATFMQRPEYLRDPDARLAIYGTFGDDDPNRREAGRLRRGLPPWTPRLVEIWDGGHAWAPAEVFERALDWIEAEVLLADDYDPARVDAYQWFFVNQLAAYRRAASDPERYLLNELIQGLPERWRLPLDPETETRLRDMAAAMAGIADDAAVRAERAAHADLREALRRDAAFRALDLAPLIELYAGIVGRYPGTAAARLADVRRQSVLRETARR